MKYNANINQTSAIKLKYIILNQKGITGTSDDRISMSQTFLKIREKITQSEEKTVKKMW